MLLLEILLI